MQEDGRDRTGSRDASFFCMKLVKHAAFRGKVLTYPEFLPALPYWSTYRINWKFGS